MTRQYTIPQCPELLIRVPNADPEKARFNAIQELVDLINEDRLSVQIPEGFSTRQLIEITEKDLMTEYEEKIINAVKVLSKLSISKQKMQDLCEKALVARVQIEILFDDKKVSQEEFQRIEDGLKTLKEFAQANLRYKKVLPDAENARSILDEALQPPQDQEAK